MSFQAVPFHASASGELPELLAIEPTATHQARPRQASAASSPLATWATGLGARLASPGRADGGRPGTPIATSARACRRYEPV
jgi:hypothetical protein